MQRLTPATPTTHSPVRRSMPPIRRRESDLRAVSTAIETAPCPKGYVISPSDGVPRLQPRGGAAEEEAPVGVDADGEDAAVGPVAGFDDEVAAAGKLLAHGGWNAALNDELAGVLGAGVEAA